MSAAVQPVVGELPVLWHLPHCGAAGGDAPGAGAKRVVNDYGKK